MKVPTVILVLYYARGVYPLRDTIKSHLYCWQQYSKYRFIYVNVAYGFPWKLLRRVRIAAVIYHTIFLGMRWMPWLFLERAKLCAPLASVDVPKIAIPQDEFIHTDMLAEFLANQRITHLYTCAQEQDWKKIYGRHLDFSRVTVKTVLTGYIDENTAVRVNDLKQAQSKRQYDLGYRARKVAYWLGEQGQHKVKVAETICEAAKRRGLRVDSSMREEDVLAGYDWFTFLLDCRATVGAEGGASVLERDGSIRTSVESYLTQHSGASFEEVRAACFPDRDRELGLACISPRHLEACLTGTCQILIEGHYNGILQPWEHYIPVQPDYSDVEHALDALADHELVGRLVRKAYVDVVESGRWTYRNFVKETEVNILDRAGLYRMDFSSWLLYAIFLLRDWLLWRVVQIEATVLRARQRSKMIQFVSRLVHRPTSVVGR